MRLCTEVGVKSVYYKHFQTHGSLIFVRSPVQLTCAGQCSKTLKYVWIILNHRSIRIKWPTLKMCLRSQICLIMKSSECQQNIYFLSKKITIQKEHNFGVILQESWNVKSSSVWVDSLKILKHDFFFFFFHLRLKVVHTQSIHLLGSPYFFNMTQVKCCFVFSFCLWVKTALA